MFFDKQEITDISIKNSFFQESCGEELCDVLASGKPKTKTQIEKVEYEEQKCGMDMLAERAAEKIRIVKL